MFFHYFCFDRRRLTSHHSDLYMTSNTERTGLVTCTGCFYKLTCTGCLSKLTCCGWLVRGWRLRLVTARVDTGVKPLQPVPALRLTPASRPSGVDTAHRELGRTQWTHRCTLGFILSLNMPPKATSSLFHKHDSSDMTTFKRLQFLDMFQLDKNHGSNCDLSNLKLVLNSYNWRKNQEEGTLIPAVQWPRVTRPRQDAPHQLRTMERVILTA